MNKKELHALARPGPDRQRCRLTPFQGILDGLNIHSHTQLTPYAYTTVCVRAAQELESTINEALDWLDETPDAELEDLEDKKKEVEQIANPIMKDLYQQAPQGGAEEDFDFGDDEL